MRHDWALVSAGETTTGTSHTVNTAQITVHLSRKADTDGDGLTDITELETTHTNPYDRDSDDDGLEDGDEVGRGTDPTVSDTDGGGVNDGDEVGNGTDPLDDSDDGPPPPRDPACSDGQDNDADGRVDLADPGCSSPTDDDEADPIPDPVRTYAPFVHLHPDDRYYPMDPTRFVRGSTLRWAHDGCPDHTLDVDVSTPNGMRALADGAFRHQADRLFRCVGHLGRRYRSNELTAPAAWKNPAHVPPRQEGFYLNLRNGLRRGVVPGGPNYPNAPPLYYSYVRSRYVVYWLFYGFNNRPVDKHEGDWEKIVVRLDEDQRATAVAYYQHFCDPTDPNTDYGVIDWDEMEQRGYLTAGTHPDVYSAVGAHASYPTVVDLAVPCRTGLFPNEGLDDETDSGGTVWATWRGQLRNTSRQAWYGYGGGWGARQALFNSDLTFGWGPLGPSPVMFTHAPPAPAPWRNGPE